MRPLFYFQDETDQVLAGWDGKIKMSFIEDRPDWAELDEPLPCGGGHIPSGFEWNGASVGPLRKLPLIGFPKWKHPIATCRHDFRCGIALTWEERLIADRLFYRDVGRGGTRWEQVRGYIGVRIGAWFSFLM